MDIHIKSNNSIVVALWNLTENDDLIDKAAADVLGLNHTDEHALALLMNKGCLPAGQMAEILHITTGASTAMIDRLEKAGFARRVDDPTDRRRVLIEITEAGKLASEKIFGILIERFQTILDGYNPYELKIIEEFLRKTSDLFVERMEELVKMANKQET